MALIFWLSSRPAPEEAKALPIIAKIKLTHLIEYGILYLLLWWAISRTTTHSKLEVFILALMSTVLFGLSDEFHQIYVPQRTASLIDATADGIGGIIMQGLLEFKNQFKIP